MVAICCGWVAICCGLVVVGALDCYGSPLWDVVVGCGGFPTWCGRFSVGCGGFPRCLKIDVVGIF